VTFRLIITAVASGRKHVVDLDRDQVLVGRRVGVDVPLPHPDIGGVHLRIERQGGGFQIIDGGASSGTRLNGEPLPSGGRRPLEDGAVIVVGDAFSLRFEARAPAGAQPTPEEGEAGTTEMARAMVRDVLQALGQGGSGKAGPSLAVTGGPAAGRPPIELPAPGRELVLGRGETCDVVLIDPDLSREQLRIRRDWGGAALCDLGSKNGTTVDGIRLIAGVDRRLEPGMTIVCGGTTLVYRDPAEAYLAALRCERAPDATPEPDPVPPPPPPRPRLSWLTLLLAALLVLAAGYVLVLLLRS
jgi:pSer/pThr/pTyr-binding forkhead associated (FHA) protein